MMGRQAVIFAVRFGGFGMPDSARCLGLLRVVMPVVVVERSHRSVTHPESSKSCVENAETADAGAGPLRERLSREERRKETFAPC